MYHNILSLCRKKGISVYRLEKDAGLSKSALCKWEHTSPSIDKVKAVARVLGVTIDELLTEDGQD